MRETVGQYRLLERIGAGGMGEVYRATDTKLHRDVAVKVLQPSLAHDPELVARLRHEGRVLAAINHPGIAAVYGLEELDDTAFLILELVEGHTLAERLAQSPLELREALTIADQVADALDAAHKRGIIHRDIKPANVKVTPDGRVKVLDFGIAKTMTMAGGEAETSTLQLLSTSKGTILGTVGYMSPEQARGLELDQRTDVWSFGCLLFELLTGRPVFTDRTAADVLAAILHGELPLKALHADTPTAVRRLLRRCLQRDVRHRMRDLGDARLDLDDALTGRADDAAMAATPADRADVRFLRLTDTTGPNETPAISPDGKMVAFVTHAGGHRQIWVRLLAGGAPLQLTRDDIDHEEPRWTPDSDALIYYTPPADRVARGTLWEIAALGGTPRPVAFALGSGDVSRDGRYLAAFQQQEGHTVLAIIRRDDGSARAVAVPAGQIHRHPRWSPDGRFVACQVEVFPHFDVRIVLIPIDGSTPRDLAGGVTFSGLAWLPDGSGLVCSSSHGSTIAYPPTFNLRRLGWDGRSRAITFSDFSILNPDVHASGRVVASRLRGKSDIWRFPIAGSPDENTRERTRVTHQTGQVQAPTISPDGREIVYLSDSGGHGNLWVTRADGAGGERQITFERDPNVMVGVGVWSMTGRTIALVIRRGAHLELWLVDADGTGLRRIVESGFAAAWSPDDRWLYYTPRWDGDFTIEKIALAPGSRPMVVRNDGMLVSLGRDGASIYFARRRADSLDFEICRAVPEDGPAEPIGLVPHGRLPVSRALMQAAISPDGQWLAMPLRDEATTNIWLMPTAGGAMRKLTDFGARTVTITRRVDWSPDGQFVFAAVADLESDVVLYDGLLE